MTPQQAADYAAQQFGSGYNCAEAVMSAITRARGVDVSVAPAAAFGGGIARQGWVCGALTGALMAMAAIENPIDATADRQRRLELISRCQELMEWFEQRASSPLCRDIVGFVLGVPGGHDRLVAENTKDRVCMGLVRDTVVRVLSGENR